MEKEGYVSLWIGTIGTQEALDEYTELIYSDDEDCFLPSQFLLDFEIDKHDFDEDFIEKICNKSNGETLEALIAGCSYNDVVVPRLINRAGN